MLYSEMTDEDLIISYKNGDDEAFGFLINKYTPLIYRFVFSLTKNQTEAEDITQLTFIKVWDKINSYKKDQKFKPWIYRIAHNNAIDYFRKKKAIVFSDLFLENEDKLDNLTDEQLLPDQVFEINENINLAKKLIEKLNSPYKEVIYLRYQEDLSLDEIAKTLKRSIDTVKSQHRRALIKIRTDLGL